MLTEGWTLVVVDFESVWHVNLESLLVELEDREIGLAARVSQTSDRLLDMTHSDWNESMRSESFTRCTAYHFLEVVEGACSSALWGTGAICTSKHAPSTRGPTADH